MSQDINYSEYVELGFKNIPLEEWSAYKKRAVIQISYITGIGTMKINSLLNVEPVRLCVCAVADTLKSLDETDVLKASESADGYSVSYRDIKENQRIDVLKNVCNVYLEGTGLMYCGRG